MKFTFSLVAIVLLFTNCNYKKIKGNGIISTEKRSISSFKKIKLAGNFDVEITPGTENALSIETDKNVIPYIITENRDGYLVVKLENNVHLSTEKVIVIHITATVVEEVHISGSGDISTKGKLTGGDQLKASISGSGNIDVEVNTPKVIAAISGSGSIKLKGETQDEEIKISGNGDCDTEELKAENVSVHVAGSGDITLFAENKLDIHIAGSGSVAYKGNPVVTQKISGSGEIRKL